jgi:hypothetical protein
MEIHQIPARICYNGKAEVSSYFGSQIIEGVAGEREGVKGGTFRGRVLKGQTIKLADEGIRCRIVDVAPEVNGSRSLKTCNKVSTITYW